MAKTANELDLSAAKRKVASTTAKKQFTAILSKLTATQSKILDSISKNKQVNCHIFTGSIAFRIGKGSIKSFSDYSSGFKGGIPPGKTAKDIFINTELSASTFGNVITKDKFILFAAYYFLINHSDRVKTESDKTEKAEGEQVLATQQQIKALVKEYGDIRLKIGNNTYQVDGFSQVGGRPKADAYFTYKGKPVVYVSLKKGSKPADFQQYGGIADLGIKGQEVSSYPDIQKFIKKIDSMFKAFGLKKNKNGKYDFNDLKKGSYFGYLISDPHTACKVIFGKDFQTGVFGLNNVNCCIDGDLKFKKTKSSNTFELDGQFHIQVNPYEYKPKKMPKFLASDVYSPVLFVAKSESQGLSQLGYDNVRFNIWPKNIPASTGIANLNEILGSLSSTTKLKPIKERYVK